MTRRKVDWALVLGIFATIWSAGSNADVVNMTRRIGEATLQYYQDRLGDGGIEKQTRAWTAASYVGRDSDSVFGPFHVDEGQLVVGLDREWGRLLGGIALSYARVSYPSRFLLGQNEPAVAGYLGYRFNDNVFFNGIVGFEHLEDDVAAGEPAREYQQPFSDISMNYVTTSGNWRVKGRAGHRLVYTIDDSTRTIFGPRDSYLNVIYGFGEVGYQIGKWQPFFRSRIEEGIYDTGGDGQSFYLGAGVNFKATKDLDLGLVYERELLNEVTEYNQAMLTAAYHF